LDFEERSKLVHTLRYGLIFIFFQNSKESVRWVGYLFPHPLLSYFLEENNRKRAF